MPDDVARGFFAEIIAGVQHCHERGICHRDLKQLAEWTEQRQPNDSPTTSPQALWTLLPPWLQRLALSSSRHALSPSRHASFGTLGSRGRHSLAEWKAPMAPHRRERGDAAQRQTPPLHSHTALRRDAAPLTGSRTC